MPTPSALKSDFVLGTWNAQTDTFTALLDLNDQVTFTIMRGGLDMPQPAKTLVKSGNLHAPGTTVPIWNYAERHITLTFSVRGATPSAISASLHALLAITENPPYCIKLSFPGASQWSYADVIAASKVTIPTDPQKLLALALTGVTIDFLCAVGLRGDRVTLQNLAPNPGFEHPSGAGVTVFNDSFANGNAYALQTGSAPTVGSSVMTMFAGSRLSFGSPAWGAINTWQLRWRWATGLTANFYLHYTDANNSVFVQETGTALAIIHRNGGTNTTIATVATALVNITFYWLRITQFPTTTYESPQFTATLYADSAGALGAQIATITGPTSFPALSQTTSLSGRPQLEAVGANLQLGGPFAGVHTVSLFGPGGWTFSPAAGSSALSGAWEGMGLGNGLNTTNTYNGGPVTSFGALRVDAPPAGTWDATWLVYSGGAPAGTWAMPCAALQTLGGSVWVRSSGLNANAVIQFTIREYDASGAFLRAGSFGQVNGNQSVWTQISGTYVTGASCAYVDIGVRAADTTVAGESANATIWADNIQLWNQTATGQTTMPWCALRFPASPAQLVVSGLLGDMPAPAFVALGTYIVTNGWLPGDQLTLVMGRRARSAAAAHLVDVQIQDAADDTSMTAILDAGSYGGFYTASTQGFIGPTQPASAAATFRGTYHAYTRGYSAQVVGSLPSVTLRVQGFLQASSGDTLLNGSGTDPVATWFGPTTSPIVAQNTWTIADAGQVAIPLFPTGALGDDTILNTQVNAEWHDPAHAALRTNWRALIPVDAEVLVATLTNPANSATAATAQWLWTYVDGLLVNRGGAGDTPAWTWSIETGPTPNPALGAGGTGVVANETQTAYISATADPYLRLDPQVAAGANVGVNQLAGFIANTGSNSPGLVMALFCEISYSPLYLTPRP